MNKKKKMLRVICNLPLITGLITFILCIGFDYIFDNCQISTVKFICKIFIGIGTASTTYAIKTIIDKDN